jgi:hypothetical protein
MSIIINGSNTPTEGSAAIGNGTELAFTAAGTSGQVLTSNGASAPTWESAGTVTSASIASANGFAGSVANATTTPAITLSTSITGVLKGNGTALSAAVAGTDYLVPAGALGTPSSGTLTNCTFPTLNQNTSGTAAGLSATLAVASGGTGVTTSTGSGAGVHATSPALTTPTITGLIEVKTAPTISSGVLALNCALGNVFHVSLNAAITSITFSNIPTGAYGLTLAFTADGTARAVTWPASVKWSGGTAPTLTSTNAKVDIFVLNTWDGSGTTWYAMVGGQNF